MTIGQFSRKTGLPSGTLRYYGQKGLLAVGRDGGGSMTRETWNGSGSSVG